MKTTLKRAARALFDSLGYDVRRKVLPSELPTDVEPEFDSMLERVRSHTMVSRLALATLYRQAVFCERWGIPGSFVECGVWKGGAVGLMALANLEHGAQRRHLHLFDAFEEICQPDEAVDGERAVDLARRWSSDDRLTGKLEPLKGIYDGKGGPGSLEENRDLLERSIGYPPEYLHYHRGWFQDTVPTASTEIDDIAILRLDGDWYASTKVCLEHLFAKVVPGGFVIIDDYGTYEGCRKAVDEFISAQRKPLFLHSVDDEVRYLVIP